MCDAQFAPDEPGQGISALARWSKGQGLRGLQEMGLSVEDHAQVADAAPPARDAGAYPLASQRFFEPVGIVTGIPERPVDLWQAAQQCPRADVISELTLGSAVRHTS